MESIIVILSIFCNLLGGQHELGKDVLSNPLLTIEKEQLKYEELTDKNRFVLHAGGITFDGIIGSNSIEALENSYLQGYRLIEIDFCWTEDRELVCLHDWDAYYAHRYGKEILTLQEFNDVKGSYYGYTSMNLDDLIQWMKKHDDVIIITDIKENNEMGVELIANRYPELKNNFWIQIYSKQEFNNISKLGFENIILTVYQMTWQEKADAHGIVQFAQNNKLRGITFPLEITELIPNYIDTLKDAQVPLFVHTINDFETQTELLHGGIAGIYTDYGEVYEK